MSRKKRPKNSEDRKRLNVQRAQRRALFEQVIHESVSQFAVKAREAQTEGILIRQAMITALYITEFASRWNTSGMTVERANELAIKALHKRLRALDAAEAEARLEALDANFEAPIPREPVRSKEGDATHVEVPVQEPDSERPLREGVVGSAGTGRDTPERSGDVPREGDTDVGTRASDPGLEPKPAAVEAPVRRPKDDGFNPPRITFAEDGDEAAVPVPKPPSEPEPEEPADDPPPSVPGETYNYWVGRRRK